jgi:AcrR family transcriptional regulator
MAGKGRRGSRREDEDDGAEEAEAALRAGLGRSAVEIAGEVGYSGLTVGRVLERAGVSRAGFYRLFADKGACYLEGEREVFAGLESELREPCRAEPDWSSALEASLRRLAAFLEAEPLLARGVLVESRIAGGEALAVRFEVLERLSHAVDAARRETRSRHSPPPMTATFILSAIEESAVNSLMLGRPERFAVAVPDLARIATLVYFGDGRGPGD